MCCVRSRSSPSTSRASCPPAEEPALQAAGISNSRASPCPGDRAQCGPSGRAVRLATWRQRKACEKTLAYCSHLETASRRCPIGSPPLCRGRPDVSTDDRHVAVATRGKSDARYDAGLGGHSPVQDILGARVEIIGEGENADSCSARFAASDRIRLAGQAPAEGTPGRSPRSARRGGQGEGFFERLAEFLVGPWFAQKLE